RPADLWNRLHVLDAGKHLDAGDRGLQPQQAVEIGDHAGEVELLWCLLLHGAPPRERICAILVPPGARGKSVTRLAMTSSRVLAAGFARVLPIVALFENGGRRERRVPLHPRVSCAAKCAKTHTSSPQVQ